MNPTPEPGDLLFEVELKVARRADELCRMRGSVLPNGLDLWSQAESEILFSGAARADSMNSESARDELMRPFDH